MRLSTKNLMLPVTLIYCMVLCFLGCAADDDMSPSDTLQPTGTDLEQLIAEALDRDKLQTRGPLETQLFYEPNQDTPYTGWVKDYYDDDGEDISMLAQVINGKYHGDRISWYENGHKKSEGAYKENKQDGIWRYWYENGQKFSVGVYTEDKQEGTWTYWYENGQKGAVGRYKKDKQEGMWTYWYEDGEKRAEGRYRNDQLDNWWTFWHDNGQKAAEALYIEDNVDSATAWTRDGQITDWFTDWLPLFYMMNF